MAFAFKPLDRRQNLQAKIDVLRRTYEIPERWCRAGDEIGEKLFRRMRQFCQAHHVFDGIVIDESEFPAVSLAILDRLLYALHQEDMYKDPFSFAMMSWLATLINEEVEAAVLQPGNKSGKTSTPLLDELYTWMQYDKAANASHLDFAKSFRSKLKTVSAS